MSFFEGKLLHVLDNDVAQRVAVTFFAFMVWSLLFLFVYSRPTTKRLVNKANELKVGFRTHKSELANRTVAVIHAATVAAGAGSLVFLRKSTSSMYVEKLTAPLTWPRFDTFSDDAVFYACLSAGFFVADLILCVVQFEEQGMQFIVHAIAGMTGCVFCIASGEGLIYLMLLMLFEVSTPFLHLRWMLMEYDMKDSIIYIINGLALVVSFTLFRLVIGIPVLAKMVYELHFTPERDRHGWPMRITFTLAPLAMCVLNSMWGLALWRGFLKAIFGKSKKHKE
jgi:hypothetical protein